MILHIVHDEGHENAVKAVHSSMKVSTKVLTVYLALIEGREGNFPFGGFMGGKARELAAGKVPPSNFLSFGDRFLARGETELSLVHSGLEVSR